MVPLEGKTTQTRQAHIDISITWSPNSNNRNTKYLPKQGEDMRCLEMKPKTFPLLCPLTVTVYVALVCLPGLLRLDASRYHEKLRRYPRGDRNTVTNASSRISITTENTGRASPFPWYAIFGGQNKPLCNRIRLSEKRRRNCRR